MALPPDERGDREKVMLLSRGSLSDAVEIARLVRTEICEDLARPLWLASCALVPLRVDMRRLLTLHAAFAPCTVKTGSGSVDCGGVPDWQKGGSRRIFGRWQKPLDRDCWK
jgi:hypothetical protein